MKELRVLIIFLMFVWLFYLFVGYALKNLRFQAPSYEVGPFNTPMGIWCSPNGVEYIVTPGSIALNVDIVGFPISCQRV